jgi:hypothetical protein
MSREAVLLQWERKIEAAERLEGERSESGAVARAAESDPAPRPAPRRFERAPESSETPPPAKPALQLVETATQPEPKRFERTPETAAAPGAERRTITGQPTPARRRRSVVEAQIAQPDRIALWAFLLGLFLVAVAAGTAHA